MGRIFVTGDTHGLLDFEKLKRFCTGGKLTRDDYIIIAGDAGIVWSKDSLEESIKAYEDLGVTILFVDGNHENYSMLEHCLNVTWWHGGRVHKISQNIYHLQRGEIYFINGKSILTVGGGESTDKEYRVENETWWPQEKIAPKDWANAINKLQGNGDKVDYIITHIPPSSILREIEKDLTQCGEDIPYYIEPQLIDTESNKILEMLKNRVVFEKWLFGHMHIDMNLGQFRCLYDDIIEVK